jgi:hypothetical protein
VSKITSLDFFDTPIVPGTDLIIPVTIVQDDDPATPVNLAGAALTFALREITGPDCIAKTALLTKTIGAGVTVTDAAAGAVEVAIDDADGPALLRSCESYPVMLSLELVGSDGVKTIPMRYEGRVWPF